MPRAASTGQTALARPAWPSARAMRSTAAAVGSASTALSITAATSGGLAARLAAGCEIARLGSGRRRATRPTGSQRRAPSVRWQCPSGLPAAAPGFVAQDCSNNRAPAPMRARGPVQNDMNRTELILLKCIRNGSTLARAPLYGNGHPWRQLHDRACCRAWHLWVGHGCPWPGHVLEPRARAWRRGHVRLTQFRRTPRCSATITGAPGGPLPAGAAQLTGYRPSATARRRGYDRRVRRPNPSRSSSDDARGRWRVPHW